ncbi:MAG: iron-containing alcohol dehydrogenase [Chloroflexi bacterium]|nr:iron-containing alcohol dehydrogenase [Chloroflexota bacterium]
MNFSLLTPAKIIFGDGSADQIAPILKSWDCPVLFVTSAHHPSLNQVKESLTAAGVEHYVESVHGEPTIRKVEELTKFAKDHHCGAVLAMGGGSVLDSGKAVSAMINNPGNIMDYLEVVGAGKPLQNPAVNMLAVPTTAGTGSEVTKNAVILVEDKHVKVSLRSDWMVPTVALIDPLLTISLPPEITASTGMDALTQVIEPYVSCKANTMTDLFCEAGIQAASQSLLAAYQNGGDHEARRKMAWASLLGGLSLANAGLGAVHGFAAVLGGMYDAPHGSICARLLPIVFETNARVLAAAGNQQSYLKRFEQVARWLAGHESATIKDGVDFLEMLAAAMDIPYLSEFGVCGEDIPEIVEKARKASSMKGNPIVLNDTTLSEIMIRAIGK